MAESTFKKLQVGPAVSYVNRQLGIKIDDIEIGGGDTGKVWETIELDEEKISNLSYGSQIVTELSEPFKPELFDKNYFKVQLINEAVLTGKPIYSEKLISKVYVDLTNPTDPTEKPDWLKDRARKVLAGCFSEQSFDYHYYQTIVVAAGMNKPGEGEKSIREEKYAFENNNIIYIQDVSQQPWEKNQTTPNEIVKVAESFSREVLEKETSGLAYVIHIKGGEGTQAFNALFCYENSQGVYIDTNHNKIWKDIEAGKIYQVTFDSTTEYWSLVLDNQGKPIVVDHDNVLVPLRDDGIAFDANKYSADGVVDTAASQYGYCFGNDNSNFELIFSYNEGFSEDHSEDLVVIGRPAGLIPGLYSWFDTEEEEWIYCEKGAYIWNIVIRGVEYVVYIPADEQYYNMAVITTNSYGGYSLSRSYQTIKLYRHTMNLVCDGTATGSYKCALSMSAVNAQPGDSNIEYLLHSDESKYIAPEEGSTEVPAQNVDWMIPVSGSIKIGETICQAIRIVATWEADGTTATEVKTGHRVIKLNYIDDNCVRQSISLITDNTKALYDGGFTDFRSVIATVATTDGDYDVVKLAIE